MNLLAHNRRVGTETSTEIDSEERFPWNFVSTNADRVGEIITDNLICYSVILRIFGHAQSSPINSTRCHLVSLLVDLLACVRNDNRRVPRYQVHIA